MVSSKGRPKTGEKSLARYLGDPPEQHPAMRQLIAAALDRGITSVNQLANRVGRDPHSVAETLRTKRPRYNSVRDLVTKGLKHPAIIARALMGRLTIAESRAALADAISDEVAQRFGLRGGYRAALVALWVEQCSEAATVDAARAALLASAGFAGDVTDDHLLGTTLGAVEQALTPHGISLRDMIAGDEAAAAAATRAREIERLAALAWICDACGVSADELTRIAQPLREAQEHVVFTAAEYERFRRAVRAAKRAFDAHFYVNQSKEK